MAAPCHILLALMVSIPYISSQKARDAICCVPDQFEGLIYLGYGMTVIDLNTVSSVSDNAVVYLNSTVSLSYDYINSRSFLFLNGTQVSPSVPKPQSSIGTIINDFKKGIQYQIDVNGTCQKSSLGNMTRQCILSGGKEVVYGFIAGGKTYAANYEFQAAGDLALKTTASVTRTGAGSDRCWPLHVVFTPSIEGDETILLYSLDVVDMTEGISNPAVFNVPAQCLKVPGNVKRSAMSLNPVIRYLSGI